MPVRLFAIVSMAVAIAASAIICEARAQEGETLRDLSQSIAQEAAVRAHALSRAPAAPAVAPPAGDRLVTQLNEFAVAALLASRAADAQDGPRDLGCIFRGMSADVAVRLDALQTAPDRAAQSRAYRAIERLARQAGAIIDDAGELRAYTRHSTCNTETGEDA